MANEANKNPNLEFGGAAEWVTWIDTCGSGQWQPVDEAQQMEPETIHSLGFVVREDDACVVLCQSLCVNRYPNVDHVLAIPKVAILERWVVK